MEINDLNCTILVTVSVDVIGVCVCVRVLNGKPSQDDSAMCLITSPSPARP